MITVLKAIKKSKLEYTKQDLTAIGLLVAAKARKEQIPMVKITQKEGWWNCRVFNYPDEFYLKMDGIFKQYFWLKKRKMMEGVKNQIKKTTP